MQQRVVLQLPMSQVKRWIERGDEITVFFTGLGKGEDLMEGGRGVSPDKSVEEIDNHQYYLHSLSIIFRVLC